MKFLDRGFQAKISLVSSIWMNYSLDSVHKSFLVYDVDLSQDGRHIYHISVVSKIPSFTPEREFKLNIELFLDLNPYLEKFIV